VYQLDYAWLLALLPLPVLVWWLMPPYREETASVRLAFFAEVAAAAGMKPASGALIPQTNFLQKVLAPICWVLVMLALARLLVQPQAGIVRSAELSNKLRENAWPVFAAMSWGSVMWIFRWYPESVQTSLRSSMKYIYQDSDHWDSLRTFLWHNK